MSICKRDEGRPCACTRVAPGGEGRLCGRRARRLTVSSPVLPASSGCQGSDPGRGLPTSACLTDRGPLWGRHCVSGDPRHPPTPHTRPSPEHTQGAWVLAGSPVPGQVHSHRERPAVRLQTLAVCQLCLEVRRVWVELPPNLTLPALRTLAQSAALPAPSASGSVGGPSTCSVVCGETLPSTPLVCLLEASPLPSAPPHHSLLSCDLFRCHYPPHPLYCLRLFLSLK